MQGTPFIGHAQSGGPHKGRDKTKENVPPRVNFPPCCFLGLYASVFEMYLPIFLFVVGRVFLSVVGGVCFHCVLSFRFHVRLLLSIRLWPKHSKRNRAPSPRGPKQHPPLAQARGEALGGR
jgi:hypothetical protein